MSGAVRALTFCAAVVLSGGGALSPAAVAAPSSPTEGIFSANCAFSHIAQDDPIVFPGEDGASHMHAFAGSRGIDENSTPDNIRGHGTTCDRPADESAYWTPTLVKDGAYREPTTAFAYYRTGGIGDPASIRPMPQRLVMIAGDGRATSPQGTRVTAWSCATSGAAGANREEMPRRCGDDPLRLLVRFPNCWDGVNLDSRDHKSHVAYSWSDRTPNTCPTSHPVPIPKLQVVFRWSMPNSSSAELSSGGEYSAHMDFMNGWDPAKMRSLTEQCLNVPQKCGTVGGD